MFLFVHRGVFWTVRINRERTEAVYTRMKAEFERIRKLYERDNVSASQYEKARANYVTAKSAFNMAASELEDTRLVAPFNGYVDEVYIEKYQDVRATQPIVSLMDIDRLRIESTGNFYSLDDIRELTIVSRSGEHFRLADIATIEEGYQTPPGNIMRIDGRPAVGIAISTVPTGNVVDMAEAVKATLDTFRHTMPEGFSLTSVYDQGHESAVANQGFITNLIISVLTVVAILLFFIGFKNGILIGSGLVFSIFATLIVMSLIGVAVGMLLTGFDFGFFPIAGWLGLLGMIIKNVIVLLDEINVQRKAGVAPYAAIVEATVSRTHPVLMAVTIIFGLTFATLLTLFVTPILYSLSYNVKEK